jgi:Uma2 family endonuclease
VNTAAEIQTRERLREPYRFTREDYDAMIAAGILDENDRVELIAGEILNKIPVESSHASTVNRFNRFFSSRAIERCVVSVQNPIALDDFSEPEPGVALLAPRGDMYEASHPGPADVYLIVEVADSSLRFDRERKIPLYAKAGIPEVWLVDLVEKNLMRYRKPVHGAYSEVSRHSPGESIPIPNAPGVELAIAELGF